ncbi:MAG: ABC transporter substrate-binding protein [Alphaproteobacteria bacterium]|nr:ABC transporter substrate-binding protein [Alphaproteobacteria bacterium]
MRRTTPLVAGLLATASITASAIPVQAQEAVQGGSLVWTVTSKPRHFNPAVQSGSGTCQPGTQIFASPLRYDEGWTPQPYLAESWSVADDGLSVTLNLVKDAKFHDGEAVTSKDVAFSIDVIQKNHPFQAMFAPVTGVDTPDDHTVVIRLSQPHPAILLAMSPALLPVIPEHIFGDGQDMKSHPRNLDRPIGSGPFRFKEYVEGQYLVLERNPDYFVEGLPYLDEIVVRIIGDGSARAIGLENGELHLSAFEQNVRDIKRMSENDGLVVSPEGYAGFGSIDWLAFNTKKGPLADTRVRQAIAYAIDRDFLTRALYLGLASEALTGVHPGSPFYNPDVARYDLDLDKANALLDEAGYPRGSDGIRFPLVIDFGWGAMKPMAEYMKPQLKKVGIEVTVQQSPDFATWSRRVSTWEFDMTMDGVFNWGDPVIGVHRTYLSTNIKNGVIWSNTQQYENARVDELLDAAGREMDPERRKALYAEFQQIVAEDVPLYPLYSAPYHTITSAKLENPPRGIWATCSPLDRVSMKAD